MIVLVELCSIHGVVYWKLFSDELTVQVVLVSVKLFSFDRTSQHMN